MRLHIEIEMGNDAVQGEGDVAGILDQYVRRLRRGDVPFVDTEGDLMKGALLDENGNTVGGWKVSDGTYFRLEFVMGSKGAKKPRDVKTILGVVGVLVDQRLDVEAMKRRLSRTNFISDADDQTIGFWRVNEE